MCVCYSPAGPFHYYQGRREHQQGRHDLISTSGQPESAHVSVQCKCEGL